MYFEPVAGLDPIAAGAYWRTRRGDYPSYKILTALDEAPPPGFPRERLTVGLFPPALRSWFISADESWILQIQAGRLYLNWRETGKSYPRFSSPGGVREKLLAELRQFKAFAQEDLGAGLHLRRVELTKVDALVEGTHWTDLADLSKLFPRTLGVLAMAEGSASELTIRFRDQTNDGELEFSMNTVVVVSSDKMTRTVRLETTARLLLVAETDVPDRLNDANALVNAVFAEITDPEERRTRFGEGAGGVA